VVAVKSYTTSDSGGEGAFCGWIDDVTASCSPVSVPREVWVVGDEGTGCASELEEVWRWHARVKRVMRADSPPVFRVVGPSFWTRGMAARMRLERKVSRRQIRIGLFAGD
jgi:hypothetical protein